MAKTFDMDAANALAAELGWNDEPEPPPGPAYSGSSGTNAFKRCIAYLDKMPDAIEGSKGSDKMYSACCRIAEFGLTGSEAWEAAQHYNATRCQPQWSDYEVQKKINDAAIKVAGKGGTRSKLQEDRRTTNATPGTVRHNPYGRGHEAEAADDRATKPEFEFETITLAELKHVEPPRYFIPGILEATQPGVIAGQYKALKTTMALELSYCLATGADFLGTFPVNEPIRVGMFSGEAGRPQLSSALSRIAAFHGDHNPWQHDGFVLSCERLPRIGDPKQMAALTRWIERNRLELAIIDPGYAALAAVGDSAGNYYKVAELLFQITDLQRQTGCTILICPHMTKAPKYDPPMLSDIQWSGFGEWAGQWLLLGKRREWDDQTGEHWLWFVAGGRSGHANTFGLDVREGRQEDICGKVFQPTIVDRDPAFKATIDAESQRKERQQNAEVAKAEESIRAAFASMPREPQIKTHVLEHAGGCGRGKAMTAAWANLLRRKEVEVVEDHCKGPNNKRVDGYLYHPKD